MAACLRAPYRAPSHPDGLKLDSTRRVTAFLHPGYGDGCNIILILPAHDGATGIHHETARIACAICAGNRWDGFFTTTRTGPRVSHGPDDVLYAEEYYFRVSDDAAERYPLVPSFAHWRFPHGCLPFSWTQAAAAITDLPGPGLMMNQSSLDGALMARDISCRITAHVEGTESVHLIPHYETVWFEENAMFRYTDPVVPDIRILYDPRNAILLRSDIHTLFDQKRIALVPKCMPHPTFVVHVLAAGSSPELVHLYHNVALQPLHAVAVEYLFARFAWSIFGYTAYVVAQDVPRVLPMVQDGEPPTLELSCARCRTLASHAPKSRGNSPQKRKRDDDDDGDDNDDDDDDDDDDDNDHHHDDCEDEPPRGRKRRRSFEICSPFERSGDDHATPDPIAIDDLDPCPPGDTHAAGRRRSASRRHRDDGQGYTGARDCKRRQTAMLRPTR